MHTPVQQAAAASGQKQHFKRQTERSPKGIQADSLTQLQQAAESAPAGQRLGVLQQQADAHEGPLQRVMAAIGGPPLQRRHRIGSPFVGKTTTLKTGALNSKRRLIKGQNLRNPAVVETLSAIDADMTHWGKYTTAMYGADKDPEADTDDDYQVHFYYNSDTGAICTTIDYKKVFRDDTEQEI